MSSYTCKPNEAKGNPFVAPSIGTRGPPVSDDDAAAAAADAAAELGLRIRGAASAAAAVAGVDARTDRRSTQFDIEVSQGLG